MHRLVLLAVLLAPALAQAGPVSFRTEVMAVLSRAGCNSGPCHGNLNGKGGFKLSLRGESPEIDYPALTRDMLARRCDPAKPDESLLLQKATGRVPHEGGVRFATTSPEAAVLRNWIAAGCPDDAPALPAKLTVTPPSRIAVDPADRVSLVATAHYADGTTRDVTGLAAFETTNVGVVDVKPSGEVVRKQFGETVVLVRYLDHQVPVSLAFIPDRPTPKLPESKHPIDRAVFGQLRELRLEPSPLSSDEMFVRRAYLDACGIVPSASEAAAFLADTDPAKRTKLIDKLLTLPEFIDYWSLKWADVLRAEEKSLDRKGVQAFHRWIKAAVAEDRPLTEFARDILAARGNTYDAPAANFYRAVRDPYQRAEAVAQVFLGVRVGCARCHTHPFDRWTQDDYHRFAAVFGRVEYRVLENNKTDRLDKHEFVGEQVVYAGRKGDIPLPRTGGVASPKLLGGAEVSGDRLAALADWAADPANPFFAKAQANRIWFHLTGRAQVDPVDDFRGSNPAANPPLLDHLTQQFAAGGYRLKPLVRHIMTSQTYQLSSSPTDSNRTDETHHARATVQPLEAEQLLDAVSAVFGVPVKFPGYPLGLRAGEVPAPVQGERRRRSQPDMGTRFLKVFGKPDRLLTCECERTDDGGLIQAFQMLTGEVVRTALAEPDNRIGKLLAAGTGEDAMLDELYLAAVARRPTTEERAKLLAYVHAAADKRAAWEDVGWGLANSKEFLLRR